MRRLTPSLALVSTLFLCGCPTQTTPTDGSTDIVNPVDAANDTGTPTGTVAQICQDYVDWETRCGVAACTVQDFRTYCPTILGHYRPEALSIIQTCLSGATTCPGDGGSPTAPGCDTNALYSLPVTDAQRRAATTLCNACPSLGGPTATAAQCEASFFTRPDGGSGTSGFGTFILIMDDATAASVQALCAISNSDAGASCTASVGICALEVLGLSGLFSGSSCRDAGGD